jgi:hypothetical protein
MFAAADRERQLVRIAVGVEKAGVGFVRSEVGTLQLA